eukprot:COSAG03_NODE_22601_length_289_cov_0.778947_1_plen_62_part_10
MICRRATLNSTCVRRSTATSWTTFREARPEPSGQWAVLPGVGGCLMGVANTGGGGREAGSGL